MTDHLGPAAPAAGCICRLDMHACPAHPREVTDTATVRITIDVTAPDLWQAMRWASGITDLVTAEFGDTMRLAITTGPPPVDPWLAARQWRDMQRIAAEFAQALAEDEDAT